MQLKLHQIIGYPSFYETIKNQKISFKTSYKLAMLAKEIEIHYTFYTDNFSKIVSEYSEKDEYGNPISTEDGQGVKLKAGTSEQCYASLNELRDLTVTLPDITFSIEEFANLTLSPMETNAIIPFVK